MKSAVIVLSWNGIDELPACLEALSKQTVPTTVMVVDNGSVDGSADFVKQHYPESILIENNANLGFSGGMNVGLRWLLEHKPDLDIVVLLNQDTMVAADWLAQIENAFVQNPQAGAVGCKIHYPDGKTLQHAGMWIEEGRATSRHFGYGEIDNGQYDVPQDMVAVTGAALGLRMSALAQVGLFDEEYNPAYYEEIDLCWRLRNAGYTIRYEPKATLRHTEGASTSDRVQALTLVNRNRLQYVFKRYSSDQFWNTFLVAERENIAKRPHFVEWQFLARAYLSAMLHCDEWLEVRARTFPMDAAEYEAMRQVCKQLRQEIVAVMR